MANQTLSLRLALGWALFHLLRGMARILPPEGLRAVLWPGATALAGVELLVAGLRGRELAPRSVPGAGPLSLSCRWRARTASHLCRMVSFLPDRYSQPRWRERCAVAGIEPVERTLAAGRPVVLATLHFGPLYLMRYWLRSLGHPVVTLVNEPFSERNFLRRRRDALSDAASGLASLPHVIAREDLGQARRLLEGPVVLMLVVDLHTGKFTEVPACDAVARVSTGAARLAANCGALLVPGLICETAPWRFRIECGPPVSCGETGESATALTASVWQHFEPVLKRHPEQWTSVLRDCFQSKPSPVSEPNVATPV